VVPVCRTCPFATCYHVQCCLAELASTDEVHQEVDGVVEVEEIDGNVVKQRVFRFLFRRFQRNKVFIEHEEDIARNVECQEDDADDDQCCRRRRYLKIKYTEDSLEYLLQVSYWTRFLILGYML